MAFHNYDAVQAVQSAREQEKHSSQDDKIEDIFLQQLQDMGINLDKESISKAKMDAVKDDDAQSAPIPRHGVGNFEEKPRYRSARARIREDLMQVRRTPTEEFQPKDDK